MAPGFLPTSKTEQYNGRVTLYVVSSCMVAALGALLYGYDSGISGGVTSMESFLKKFFPEVYRKEEEDTETSNYCQFASQLLTSFTSSLYIAGCFTSFLASYITGSFGRNPSIVAGGATFLAGGILCGSAVNVYMLIIGRLLLGVGVGFANQSVPLYLSEMAPAKLRGAISNGFTLVMNFGIIFAATINYYTEKIEGDLGWRVSLGLAALPATLLILGSLFLTETPNSLIQQSKDPQRVKLILQRIRGTDDVQSELDDLIEASSRSKTIRHPFKIILKRKYRPELVMSIAIPFFQQITGVNAIAFYAPLLFKTVGFGESASLLSVVMLDVLCLVAVLISMLLVDRFGRRTLLISGGIQMFVSYCIIGGIMAAKLKDKGELSEVYAYLVLVFTLIYLTGFSCSWGPMGWLIPSEIFPLEIRSAGQSVNVAVNFLMTAIVAQTFLAMLCKFKFGVFFFFAGWLGVMTMFVYYLLPETKNVPIEQMQKVWQEHWFWGRIVLSCENTDDYSLTTNLDPLLAGNH